MPTAPRHRSRLARFFFMHLGTLIAIIVYFTIGNSALWSLEGLRRALWTALLVKTGYMIVARLAGELKYFDVGLWLFFAFGAVAVSLGMEPIVWLYQHYSPALLFATFALAALLPLAAGREPFTVYFARRQTPVWQHRTPAFHTLNRVLAAFWGVLFLIAAALCAYRPTDPMYTFVLPNLLVLGVGIPAGFWLPPLWLRFFPSPLPDTAEPLIMGMPFMFQARAAEGVKATIQFRVSGAEPGDYFLRVDSGKCQSFQGLAPAADLTVHTPGDVWARVARGELNGERAYMEQLYTVEGDFLLLAKMQDWFRPRA